jgi:hypothetical protein
MISTLSGLCQGKMAPVAPRSLELTRTPGLQFSATLQNNKIAYLNSLFKSHGLDSEQKKPGHKHRVRIGGESSAEICGASGRFLLSTLVMDIQFGRQFRSVTISLVNDPSIQLCCDPRRGCCDAQCILPAWSGPVMRVCMASEYVWYANLTGPKPLQIEIAFTPDGPGRQPFAGRRRFLKDQPDCADKSVKVGLVGVRRIVTFQHNPSPPGFDVSETAVVHWDCNSASRVAIPAEVPF